MSRELYESVRCFSKKQFQVPGFNDAWIITNNVKINKNGPKVPRFNDAWIITSKVNINKNGPKLGTVNTETIHWNEPPSCRCQKRTAIITSSAIFHSRIEAFVGKHSSFFQKRVTLQIPVEHPCKIRWKISKHPNSWLLFLQLILPIMHSYALQP